MFGGKSISRFFKKLTSKNFYMDMRSKKDILVQRLFSPLLKLGVSADIITSAGLVSGVISLTFLNSSHILFLSFWSLTRIMDLIDGSFYRYNNKTWFKNVNLDKYADITYDTLLTFSAIPYTGFLLVASSLLARALHLKIAKKEWGSNLFAPHTAFTHALFIFRRFREGLIIQIIYSLFTPVAKKVLLRVKK